MHDNYPFDDAFPFGKPNRSAEFNPASGSWLNYGDLSRQEVGTLYLANNYTGPAAGDLQAVQSIDAGPYGTRGLRETTLTGPMYHASTTFGAYTGPALYFNGFRLIADDASFADFGSHSVVILAAVRSGPASGSVFNKGQGADGTGTLMIDGSEFRLFNGSAQSTGNFVGGTHTLSTLSYTYDHGTGVHSFWRNGGLVYSGTGPGSNGGRCFVLGQGAGGFACADFYLLKWAMKRGVMTEDLRIAQEARFA